MGGGGWFCRLWEGITCDLVEGGRSAGLVGFKAKAST